MSNWLKILKKYSFLFGFIVLIIIIVQADLKNIFDILKNSNYIFIIIGILFVIPTIIAKAWRWNYLKKIQGIKYKLFDSFLIYSTGLLIGNVTPGKIGEIAKIYYLKKDGHSTGKSLVSVVLDRLADIVYLMIFGYLGIIFTLQEFRSRTNILYLMLLLSLIFLIIIIKKGWPKIIIKKIFYRLVPKKYQESWHTNYFDFLEDLKLISIKKYFILFIITIISWLIYYYQIYIFSQSINLQVSIIPLVIAVTISGLITLLPISFLGIGTREATLIILLKPFVDDISSLIILSQLILLANIFSGLIGAICWKIKPISLKSYG